MYAARRARDYLIVDFGLVERIPMTALPLRLQPVNATFYSLTIERRMLEMTQRAGIYFSEADKALMWDRRQTGDSLARKE
jgi:hypothetical protein